MTDPTTPLEPSEAMFQRFYDELRSIAHRELGNQRRVTIQTTALVHEAYMKLSAGGHEWPSERAFMATASKVLRHVLISEIRKRRALKRGGDKKVPLFEVAIQGTMSIDEIVALDDALEELTRLQPRHARLIEMRFFGGLSVPEAAQALDISVSTAESDWRSARAWLAWKMGDSGAHS